MHALVPIISNQEASTCFAERISKEYDNITILIVVDASLHDTSSGATNFLAEAQNVAERLRKMLCKKRKSCEIVIEWGELSGKIDRIARLKRANKVFLLGQESKEFKALVKVLSKSSAYKVEVVRCEES